MLILASTSKIRKQILKEVRLKFKVVAPLFDEEKAKKKLRLSPQKLPIFLAKGKALSISQKFPDAYVIGSDQVCEFQNQEIPKSKNANEALTQLRKFNGKIHFQNNAVVVAHKNKIIFENFSRVKMTMRKMPIKEIENYISLDKPFGCAGSYRYESLGKHLFKKTEGDYFSILGLAIQPLIFFLNQKKILTYHLPLTTYR